MQYVVPNDLGLAPDRASIWYIGVVLCALLELVNVRCDAQMSTTAASNAIPDPRIEEARRRLVMSHRRRGQQINQNIQTTQIIEVSNLAKTDTIRKRVLHRPSLMHRNTTALGRKAVVVPASIPTAQSEAGN